MNSRGIYMPFLVVGMIGSGILVRKLGKSLPNIMEKMMSHMKEGMMGEGGPMNMCKQMMENMAKSQGQAEYATPELREAFEGWLKNMESEVLEFIKKKTRAVDHLDIAAHFKISLESAVYLVNRLASHGKLKYSGFEATV